MNLSEKQLGAALKTIHDQSVTILTIILALEEHLAQMRRGADHAALALAIRTLRKTANIDET